MQSTRRLCRAMARGPALAVILLLFLAPAHAHPESAAPDLRQDVVGAGHTPEVPEPGSQWRGHVQFAPGHNVSHVNYQICRVGQYCFAPPTPAQRDGDRFQFDTADYVDPISEGPVAWGMGDGSDWMVGYKFLLTHEDGSQAWFPEGLPHTGSECAELSFIECDATHYFVFTMPGAQATKDVPGPLLILPILGALLARRDRHA